VARVGDDLILPLRQAKDNRSRRKSATPSVQGLGSEQHAVLGLCAAHAPQRTCVHGALRLARAHDLRSRRQQSDDTDSYPHDMEAVAAGMGRSRSRTRLSFLGADDEEQPTHQVELVDEQNDAAVRLLNLVQHGLQPLLELAPVWEIKGRVQGVKLDNGGAGEGEDLPSPPASAYTAAKGPPLHPPVLGACHQRPHVQGNQADVLQHLRHVAAHDALRRGCGCVGGVWVVGALEGVWTVGAHVCTTTWCTNNALLSLCQRPPHLCQPFHARGLAHALRSQHNRAREGLRSVERAGEAGHTQVQSHGTWPLHSSSGSRAAGPPPQKPTGSPISTGLFFVRRHSTRIMRRISSSRPITGSRCAALAVRSTPYLRACTPCV